VGCRFPLQAAAAAAPAPSQPATLPLPLHILLCSGSAATLPTTSSWGGMVDAAGTTLLALTDRVAAMVMSRRFAQQFFPLATARLRPTAVLGALLLSAGLGSLGVLSLISPGLASSTYGLPAGGVADSWVSATGLRDLGLAVSTLVLLRHAPDAISYYLWGVLVIPAGDAAIVVYSGGGSGVALPHLVGVVAVATLLLSCVHAGAHKSL
jgi:hypothetical protein